MREYIRTHVRVPIQGKAILAGHRLPQLTAVAIDISEGGIALSSLPKKMTPGIFNTTVILDKTEKIFMQAELIRTDGKIAGFRTAYIDDINLRRITDLVFRYQETTDFVDQIHQHNILDQYYFDDNGNEFEVTFNVDKDKP